MDIITLERGRTRVTIAPELGGRIAQIEIADGVSRVPLLYEPPGVPPEERDPLSWGSFVMAPWPNRIAEGRFTFQGATYQLPVNHEGHAIHGLGWDRTWAVEHISDIECVMSLTLDDRWPWRGRVSQRVELLDDGLRQTTEIASVGGRFPAGCGWHPWFRRDVRPGAEVRVLVDADERDELAPGRIPTGRILPVDGDFDLRAIPALGDRRLDDCYRGVRGPMRLAWGDIELTMTSSANVTYAVVYTPEHAVCVEPQTCAIDAFNLDARGVPAGTAVVEEGHPLVATTEWLWSMGTDPSAHTAQPPRASDRSTAADS
jgi:aldose 1-epimerase